MNIGNHYGFGSGDLANRAEPEEQISFWYMGFYDNQGYLLGGPYKEEYSILESVLGAPI